MSLIEALCHGNRSQPPLCGEELFYCNDRNETCTDKNSKLRQRRCQVLMADAQIADCAVARGGPGRL
jgi:hypothetical protein